MLSRRVSLSFLLITLAIVGIASWTSLRSKPSVEAVRPTAQRRSGAASGGPTNAEASAAKVVATSLPVSEKPDRTETRTTPVIEAFTEPYRDISVAASEMGTLAEVGVREGDVVAAGDKIAVLDEDVLRASLEVARRSMSSEGALKSAQADVDLKKADSEKMTQLRDRNHASQQEVDRIGTELIVAEARLLSVREDLEVKQLEFRRIEAQIEQRIVRSPIAGIVSEVQREAGEFVSPSEPVIARIVQLDPLLIVFSLPLELRNDVAKDQVVSVEIGRDAQLAEGTVEYVAPTPDPSNSSVRVKVRLPNAEQRFQSGERSVLRLNRTAGEPATESPGTSTLSPLARREP